MSARGLAQLAGEIFAFRVRARHGLLQRGLQAIHVAAQLVTAGRRLAMGFAQRLDLRLEAGQGLE